VTITGSFTHFSLSSVVTFSGTGITAGAPTAATATNLTVPVTIAANAPLGAQGIQVVTGAETVSLANAFTVATGMPVITQVNPNTGQQGQQNESVAITGAFTHFVQGTTTASFGAGITVATLTINSATSATAVLNIDPAAATGARNVTLTTGAEAASLTGFTVNTPTPAITLVNPNTGVQGQQNESVAITGQFTHWVQGTTTASFGAGITVATLTINSATSATAVLNIDPAAAVGARNVTLTTGAEVASLTNGFAVSAGTPILLTVVPNTGQEGQQSLSVNITGQHTHFLQGKTVADFGAGVTLTSLTVNSPTTATALLNIDPATNAGVSLNFFPASAYNANTAAMDATLGTTGHVIDDFETATLIQGLTIQLSGGVADTTFTSLPGLFNQTDCGTLTENQAWDGNNTATNATGNLPNSCTIPNNVATNITFNYALGTTSFGIGLSNFQSINPASPSFPITNHELFVNGVDMGVLETLAGTVWTPGLKRNAYLRIDGVNGSLITSVRFQNLSISAEPDFLMFDHLAVRPPTTGVRNVTMTTDTEVATLVNGFTVTTPASVIQVSPNSGLQGQQNLSITITGQFTHWVQGTTTASFGRGSQWRR
jgi:hypothetical protein